MSVVLQANSDIWKKCLWISRWSEEGSAAELVS